MTKPAGENVKREPRWPAVVATLSVAGIYLGMPDFLTVGPQWLLLLVVAALLVPTVAAHHLGSPRINHLFGTAVTSIITAAMVASIWRLVQALPEHRESPIVLLKAAAFLWLANVLVFASWYWRLDAGGPYGRDARPGHSDGAFLFPQMTLDVLPPDSEEELWSPQFVDYLFLAFNTSTALSPADTQALSRWAKILMMLQALISLTIVILLAARAVNIM